MATVIDRLHGEFIGLLEVLDRVNEISLRSAADDNFRKSLLLSAASYFEQRTTESILEFVSETANSNPLITSFVRNKAVSRQYHTWFNWDVNNANQFFGLFGKEFRTYMEDIVKQDQKLDSSVRAFLELGRERNRLVHQDFASFPLEKTSEEIYQLYCIAKAFVEFIPIALRNFSKCRQNAAKSPL